MSKTNWSEQDAARSIVAGLLGHAVGDALGVPVEFRGRLDIAADPVADMRAYGTHHQPAGTWSDDTPLTLCAAEALCHGFDLRQMGDLFVRWLEERHWTPHGDVFDIGSTTRHAIARLKVVDDPVLAGLATDESNGNGSLMRILPVACFLAWDTEPVRRQRVMDASRLTHGHQRSQLACAMYAEVVAYLLRGVEFTTAVEQTRLLYRRLIADLFADERGPFEPLLHWDLAGTSAGDMSGSGYVIDCLFASLWCCATTGSFDEAVLAAVNLGDDTDTTGAVTGGLAGLIYGKASIPQSWLGQLARGDEVAALYETFTNACVRHWKERER